MKWNQQQMVVSPALVTPRSPTRETRHVGRGGRRGGASGFGLVVGLACLALALGPAAALARSTAGVQLPQQAIPEITASTR